MKLVTVQEMISIENEADLAGHTYAEMMEAAGRGLAVIIHDKYGSETGRNITALVGSGNNGGDALVALDHLMNWGWKAEAFILKQRPVDDPLVKRVLDRGGILYDYSDPDNLSIDLEERLAGCDLLLDGVLGTGIKLPLRSPLDTLLGNVKEILNVLDHKLVIVAVDCPSGVDCDSGEVSDVCLEADLTVTMAAVKAGTLRFPAFTYVGELEVVEIGLPPGLVGFESISRETIEEDWVFSILPNRPLNAHKGTFGTSMIIAGSEEYPGAVILAGEAAYKIGSGLVTMAVPASIYPVVVKSLPEATWIVLKDDAGGISHEANHQVNNALEKPTALLIGPGLGTRDSTKKFLASLLKLDRLPPMVIDADGLRHLSGIDDWEYQLAPGSVLTPHPGEMAALTGLTVEEIQSSRIEIAEEYAHRWQQIILLKGAHSIIAAPDGKTRILISANPALARAGSGDVLAGIITGLIAQGLGSFDAAAAGSWIHARAGEIAVQNHGNQAAVIAGDISNSIGQVFPD